MPEVAALPPCLGNAAGLAATCTVDVALRRTVRARCLRGSPMRFRDTLFHGKVATEDS